jgi:hypothetical protein
LSTFGRLMLSGAQGFTRSESGTGVGTGGLGPVATCGRLWMGTHPIGTPRYQEK